MTALPRIAAGATLFVLSAVGCTTNGELLRPDAGGQAESDAPEDTAHVSDTGSVAADTESPVPDTRDAQPTRDTAAAPDTSSPRDTSTPVDAPTNYDAEVASTNLPGTMKCGETMQASITMKNTSTIAWTRARNIKLGTIDDSDPFYDKTRVWLPGGVSVAPGESHTFEFQMKAPDMSGDQTTDWQMVRENVGWFGEEVVQTVSVKCNTQPKTPPPLDLNKVNWLYRGQNYPNMVQWKETGNLMSVTFRNNNNQICLNYDKAGVWPDNGDGVVANPWVFIYNWQQKRWDAATFEWMRPGQKCKFAYSVAGDHIKIAPYDKQSMWKPKSGQTLYFMVSGLVRLDERNVQERTNVQKVVWP